MEESQMIEKDSVKKAKPTPLLLCPYCKKNIPILMLNPSKGAMEVTISCSCSKKPRNTSLRQFVKSLKGLKAVGHKCAHHSINADKYCIKCESWLCRECISSHIDYGVNHVLLDQELNVKCSKHCKPYSHYCKQCLVNCCPDCLKDHLNDPLIKLRPVGHQLPETNAFTDAIQKNWALTHQLIQQIDQKNKELNKMKENIESACKANECVNRDLEKLFRSLCETASACRRNPSYELNKQLQTIIINKDEFKKPEKAISNVFTKLKAYLQNNYALKQISANKCIASLAGHESPITSIIQLNDERIASGAYDKTIKLWSIITNEITSTLTGHNHCVSCLIQLKDGRLASGSYDNTIKLWNTSTNNKCLVTFAKHSSSVVSLVQLTDGRLASGSYDKTIKLWSTFTNQFIATLTGHDNCITNLLQLNDGRLASSSFDNTIKLWDTQTNACTATLTDERDCNYALIQQTNPSNNANCLILLKDGRLASCSNEQTIKLWNTETNECVASLKGHSYVIYSLLQLDDGRLMSSSNDKTLMLWSTSTHDRIATLKNINSPSVCLIQLNDGRVASTSAEVIQLWDF